MVFGTVAAAIVAVLLIGGIVRSGSQSTGYQRDVNRSYADQADVLAARSDVVGARLGSIVLGMSGATRSALQATLDTLVRAADELSREAATLQSPAPSDGAGNAVATAFADRATAVSDVRRTVDRLLGMSPLPVVESVDPPSSVAAAPPPLSAIAGERALEHAGALVASANRAYAAARRALRAAPGHAPLARSDWSKGAVAWTGAGARSVVAALLSSPTLAAVHQVVLVAHALALAPAPVPAGPSTTPASGVVVPPTRRISVSAVVANDGNVAASHVVVSEQLTPAASAPGTTVAVVRHSRTLSLAAGSSESLSLPALPVVPGGRYTLTVTVVPPVPDGPGAVTSDAVPFTVGPPSPPTVTQITPAKGRARGGTHVTILGSGFSLATAVTFGTADARFTVVSDSEITAVSPPGTGTVTVGVVDAGGPSGYSPGSRFTYKQQAGTTTTTGGRVDQGGGGS